MRFHRTRSIASSPISLLTAAVATAQMAWLFLFVVSTATRTNLPHVASLAFSSSATRSASPRRDHPRTVVSNVRRFATLTNTNAATSNSARGDAFVRSDDVLPTRQKNQTDDLWNYVLSLQRTRRSTSSSSNTHVASERHCCQPAYSLVGYLSSNVVASNVVDYESKDRQLLEDVLSRSLVQGIRLAADCNDYKLIIKLVDATIHFADSNAVMHPRILAEAIDGLARTTASVGKINRVWRALDFDTNNRVPAYLTAGAGPLEANAMLKALTSRGKIGSALKLFRDNCASKRGRTDSYSLSILFEGLASSIHDNDGASMTAPAAQSASAESTIRPSVSLRRFRPWATSPYWQWNEAVSALDFLIVSSSNPKDCGLLVANNHVASALLKLNVRAGEAFRDHDTAQFTLEILDWMEEGDAPLTLDVVTCTLLLKGLRSRSKAAVQLFRRMRGNSVAAAPIKSSISFAAPNEYCYSAVIAACAKNRQYQEAFALLEELHADPSCKANAHVYNSVLQALVTTSSKYPHRRRLYPSRTTKRMRREARHRWELAMQVFHEMNQSEDRVLVADSITYNTLLMVLAGTVAVLGESDWWLLQTPTARAMDASLTTRNAEWVESLPHILIERMTERRLPRDDASYRHAFSACTTFRGLSRLVEHAIYDQRASLSRETLYSALPVAAYVGEFDGLCKLLQQMPDPMDSKSISHVIHSLGVCQKTSLIPVVTRAMLGDSSAAKRLETELGCQVFAAGKNDFHPDDASRHFEAAIQTCLRAKDVGSAGLVIAQVKDGSNNREMTPAMFQEVARMYVLQGLNRLVTDEEAGQTSSLKAYTVLQCIPDPPVSLMVLVAKSLAHTGSFGEAGDLLERIHNHVSAPRLQDDANNSHLVQKLHKSLLSSCAASGNVTAALRFCECIQTSGSPSRGSNSIAARDASTDVSTSMNVAEWRLLLVAALKSGHWRVCLSTLQFLKPHVKALRPKLDSASHLASEGNRRYQELSSALNLVIKCLALRGQYGWIVRVLNDWVAWSGRRPPKQSVFLAIRALCARGRGIEVGNLLAKCLTPKPLDESREGSSYEIALAVFAVTSLYNEGLYDAADDVFITAIRSKTLPLNLREDEIPDSRKRRMILDLHGMNLAVAHSAVRIALQQVARDSMVRHSGGLSGNENELVIVTGRGRTSALRMRPVLRPEVQRMLVEEFYPPLSSSSMPGNMGALRVPGEDIQIWLDNQRVAKRSRVMTVAALLKKISSNAMRAAVTISASGGSAAPSTSE